MISLLPLLIPSISAFYLPGVAPKDYPQGQSVPLHVNALDAEKSLLPYDFYHEQFHFCKPEKGPKPVRESLGSALFGDRIFTSKFEVGDDAWESLEPSPNTPYNM